MDSDRRTTTVVGVLFIVATVASILGSVVLGSLLDGPRYLPGVAAQEGRVVGAALLFLVAASSAVATAFLLFPILRRYAEGLAAGYVVVRTFENVLYVAGVVGLLVMGTVGRSDAIGSAGPPDVALIGTTLLALHDWSVLVGTLLFAGLGSVTLNWVLYRFRLVPRWLSAWGLVGAPLLVVYGVLGILGVDTAMGSPFMLLAMPIAVQEMVFAGWLIAKGIARRPAPSGEVPTPRVEAVR